MIKLSKYLGQGDAYVDITTKYFSRVSSVMIWIGFFTYMSTIFSLFWLIVVLIALVMLIIFLVWFDVKFILPNKQEYYGNKNPFFRKMWNDIKAIKKTLEENDNS